MDELLTGALQASIANPNDEYEVDLIADAASVGLTEELFRGGKRIEWTEEMLASAADSLRGMPINLKEPDENGVIDPHTNIVIGRVEEATYDKARQKLLAKGKLWKHYFPDTIQKLNDMMKDESKRPQTSIEFQPTAADYPDDKTIKPKAGRFIGLGIVNTGADKGNFVHLLASAKVEEAAKKREDARKHGVPMAGSLEWIGEKLFEHLNASASPDSFTPKEVVATYSDRAVWYENGTYYQVPFTIDRTSIEFGDTIEVETDFKPVNAAVKSEETPTVSQSKEAVKPMAEINDTELEALKASAKKATDLESELATLKASAKETEDKLAAAEKELADAKEREENAKLEKLAAARVEEVEKIQKYETAEERTEALESFKTLDEKSFEFLKKALQAAATPKGGVSEEERIRNPFESSQDPDGEAKKIVDSPEFKALVASVSTKKENE